MTNETLQNLIGLWFPNPDMDMDSESSVLGYGIGAIMLNVGMYVGIPVLTILGIKKI